MGIDATAVARGFGLETNFKDLAGGAVRNLPQRVAIIAQGQEGISYGTSKFLIDGGAKQIGDTLGYGSPAYHIARELFPVNGDGLGTIPVEMIPLAEPPAAVASLASIVASGTTTGISAYRVKLGGVDSQQFVIDKGVVDASLVHGRIVAAINAVLGMPMTAANLYGTVTATPDGGNVGDGTVTALAVSSGQQPRAGSWSLVCTLGGAAAEFSLTDSEGDEIATGLTDGAQVNVGGLDFTITYGAGDFAEGDSFVIDVPSTQVDLTANWKGRTGDKISLQIEEPAPSLGALFALTQPNGGAVDADVSDALLQIGDVWTTAIVTDVREDDETALDAFASWNEGRWGPLVHKPALVYRGSRRKTVSDVTAVTSLRTADRTNVQLIAPESPNMPWVIASAQLVRIATRANNNPPYDYGSQRVFTVEPGPDVFQFDYAQRDAAVKGGSSTIEIRDGVVNVSDVVTSWSPVGEEPPAYRFAVDVCKISNVIHQIALEFQGEKWDGRPLIPDGQATTNPDARTPSMAKGAMAAILDALGLAAIISDPTTAKKNTVCGIDGSNPKRLNITTTVQIAGAANIRSVDLNFGFFFPSAG